MPRMHMVLTSSVICQIVELDDVLEITWHICLNNGASRISKSERYEKSGEVMEGPRRDGRPGILRSQLTITPEGHVHIRYQWELGLSYWWQASCECILHFPGNCAA